MARDDMIGVRVSEAEKKKFEKHIEDTSEYDSVPRMMRSLTRDHINGYGEEATTAVDAEELVNAVEIGLSSVHERLEELEDMVAEVNAATVSSDEHSALAHDIVAELPVYPDGPEFPHPADLDSGSPDNIQTARALSTAGAWANYFEVDDDDARSALARALRFPDVKFVEGESGYRRYYKTTEDI
ncbi:hypothetical protein [Haloferax sulfurifontis]|uniref:Uncharacterized protein n=1 Tax=Haloferax sulfurifontis TaxID=255616 RepID=A0A830DQ19_9EURY|nr:hypothetical protein [Haloferax sulfurifontis]GGC49713.1 hypothetical protein GCM10007209_09210 [Haloferax sulfurifontis]